MASTKNGLIQGTLELLILATLKTGPKHGHGIVQSIRENGDGRLNIEDGSLYPALYRLEGRGFVAAEWGVSENNRKAKFYKITAAGRKGLESERENWETVSEAISKVLRVARA